MQNIQKILFPTDFSEASLLTARHAFDWARRLQATIEILHVVDNQQIYAAYADMMSYYPELDVKILEGAKKDMDVFMEKLSVSGPTEVSTKIETGNPAELICKYAIDGGFGLIVIGTHGRQGVQRLMLGSVAEKVVRLSQVPVLTVRLNP